FFPRLSSTPVATCIGVIGLVWLTTVANFGGPRVTGRIGSVTVWGVILPVGLLSIIGWFWFSGHTFAAAWNPQGIGIAKGLGSSVALTLWAFLGMESAAQNSSAVEDPKKNVPLACMLGTLGAAFVYILSTTVIQCIVPNAELTKSTGLSYNLYKLNDQINLLVDITDVINFASFMLTISGLMVKNHNAHLRDSVYRRNTVLATVEMVHSVYAIFAPGKDAVLGGMIVM